MFSIGIEESSLKRFRTATGAIDKRLRFWKTELPRMMFIEYYRRVLLNIMVQKYAAEYLPLRDKYLNWKMRHGYSESFWVKRGRVIDALRDIKPTTVSNTAYTSRFVAALDIPYIKLIEKGYRGRGKGGSSLVIPPRPVFGPTLNELKKEFNKWSKMVFKDIKMAWGK